MFYRIIVFIVLIFTQTFLFAISIHLDPDTKQGEVIRIILWDDEDFDQMRCDLMFGDRTVSTGRTFVPFETAEGGPRVKEALLGVPSDYPGNTGKIRIEYDDSGKLLGEFEIRVSDGDFIEEEISLNTAMSELRQEDNPEKARQWRMLYGILTTFNPEDVFMEDEFMIPVDPDSRRTSFYGDRRTFVYTDGEVSRSIHHGIDFSGTPGTEIRSGGDGKVVFSGKRILSGETIVIEHLPGVYSSCYHMKNRFVSEGEKVEKGALIGTIGATGLVTGAHLHWEIRVNGISVAPDPLTISPLIDKRSFMSIIEGP